MRAMTQQKSRCSTLKITHRQVGGKTHLASVDPRLGWDAMDAPRPRRLARSGLTAELRPDMLGGPGFTLLIGGEQQSHVFVDDPRALRFDYLRRVANLVDLCCTSAVGL
jgi:hypothetical protein